MFYPFNRVRTIDNFGIPVLKTIYVTTDTAGTSVTYGICPKLFKQLPCEGLFLLNVVNTPPTTAIDTYTVNIDPTMTVSQANATTTTTTSSSGRALLNGSGAQETNANITTGNRYLVYFNKTTGTFQVVNHIPAAAT